MLILVTGGAASGKSEHAERLGCEKAQSRLYLATMQPFGKSAEARIARHRALRAGKGFATVERTLDLANLRLSRQYDGILLEDLGNLLANELFESVESLIRLDMSEYMEKHSVSKMIGSPPGYVGFEEGGQLSEKVRTNPYSVVLFDEIEKAHSDVFNILLQVLDDGHITDSQGRKVDFKNTIIIMTSNTGAQGIVDPKQLGFVTVSDETKEHEKMKSNVMDELKRTFKPEFLNRIDDIIVFHALSEANVKDITGLMLKELKNRVQTQMDIELKFTDHAKKYIFGKGYDKKYGARPLRRALQTELEDKLADAILNGEIQEGDHVAAGASKKGIHFVKTES